ncbi:hypothetical protein, partial [Haematobacter sp. UBA3484]
AGCGLRVGSAMIPAGIGPRLGKVWMPEAKPGKLCGIVCHLERRIRSGRLLKKYSEVAPGRRSSNMVDDLPGNRRFCLVTGPIF